MNILFVCTGNTCRSCMAEVIFNDICDVKDIKAFSAGTNAIVGSKTSNNSALILKKNLNIDISDRKAVNINEATIKNADLILTMTESIAHILKSKYQNLTVSALNKYVSLSGEIPDPYGQDLDVYQYTFDNLKYSIKLLIKKIKEDKGI
ncbi:MAG: low molecular weight protein arginine phosphatase [Clostridium sp.]|nr:low molecular weight protein arginine phosphatase [Clostridium sp.]